MKDVASGFKNKKVIMGIIVLAVVLSLTNQKFKDIIGPVLPIFIIFALMVIAAILINAQKTEPTDRYMQDLYTHDKDHSKPLGLREKKLMIFHLITLLERKESIDVNEIVADFNISVYSLSDIIQFLSKSGVANAIYPPMHNFPILRKGDLEKIRKMKYGIYREVSRTSIFRESKMAEFSKEVNEYLETMRRAPRRGV